MAADEGRQPPWSIGTSSHSRACPDGPDGADGAAAAGADGGTSAGGAAGRKRVVSKSDSAAAPKESRRSCDGGGSASGGGPPHAPPAQLPCGGVAHKSIGDDCASSMGIDAADSGASAAAHSVSPGASAGTPHERRDSLDEEEQEASEGVRCAAASRAMSRTRMLESFRSVLRRRMSSSAILCTYGPRPAHPQAEAGKLGSAGPLYLSLSVSPLASGR